jgi:hypothetical protein
LGYIPGVGWVVGQAPKDCQKYADAAINMKSQALFLESQKQLGYSSHFLSDVGNPLHAGKALEQLADLGVLHNQYELYVAKNWAGSGTYDFGAPVQENEFWYSIGSPDKTTKNLARYSNGYIDVLWGHLKQDKEIQDDETVTKITRKCLLQTVRNDVGLIKFVLD